MIDLSRYPSRCEPTQREIVSRDHRHPYCHVAHNPHGKSVLHYHMDGGVLPEGQTPKRCDFLLINQTDGDIYLIELKGGPALLDGGQMDSTENLCRDSLRNLLGNPRFRYRFVMGNGRGVYSSAFLAWRDKKPRDSVITERGKGPRKSFEEVI